MTRPAVDTRLTAKEYDAKKAELELRQREISDRIKALADEHAFTVQGYHHSLTEATKELAALGPRPEERSVTWTNSIGNLVTWTFTDGKFWTEFGGSANDGLYISSDVPHDVALRVQLLAWPEEPVRWMNVYKGEYSTWRTEEDARTCAAKEALEVAVPLYRIPVGIAAGACVVVNGKVQGTFSTVRTDPQAALAHAKEFASNFDGTVYDLIAVPRKEAT